MDVEKPEAPDIIEDIMPLEGSEIYNPGGIKAVGYNTNGEVLCEKEILTAGPPNRLELISDRTTIFSDGTDLSFITVKVTDREGNLCPNADYLIQFNIVGGDPDLRWEREPGLH